MELKMTICLQNTMVLLIFPLKQKSHCEAICWMKQLSQKIPSLLYKGRKHVNNGFDSTYSHRFLDI